MGCPTRGRDGRSSIPRVAGAFICPSSHLPGWRGGLECRIAHRNWLASSKREEFFGPLGVTNIRTFVDPQNPSQVALLMDVADMDAVMAAMQTKAASEAMADDGVLTETLVILVEE
jgi:hypothetical protein